jgi:ketosteroid isomerase-like protein
MSQENVELVRRLMEVWDRGDYEALNALTEGRVAPDFELDPLYLDRVYKGDEAQQLGADMAAVWEDYRATTEEVVDLGAHVLIVRHITARGAIGGVPVDFRIFILVRFEGEIADVLAFHRLAEPPVQRGWSASTKRFPETLAALAQLPRAMRDEQPP